MFLFCRTGGANDDDEEPSSGVGVAWEEPRWKRVPRTDEAIALLEAAQMLPAIVFVFSRAGCDAAAAALGGSTGAALTSADEQATILAELEELRRAPGVPHHVLHQLPNCWVQ